jgi:hypothetical protein
MHRLFVSWVLWLLFATATRAEPPSYLVFVSNERSGDVTVIDGTTDGAAGTFQWANGRAAFTLRPMVGESLLR